MKGRVVGMRVATRSGVPMLGHSKSWVSACGWRDARGGVVGADYFYVSHGKVFPALEDTKHTKNWLRDAAQPYTT